MSKKTDNEGLQKDGSQMDDLSFWIAMNNPLLSQEEKNSIRNGYEHEPQQRESPKAHSETRSETPSDSDSYDSSDDTAPFDSSDSESSSYSISDASSSHSSREDRSSFQTASVLYLVASVIWWLIYLARSVMGPHNIPTLELMGWSPTHQPFLNVLIDALIIFLVPGILGIGLVLIGIGLVAAVIVLILMAFGVIH